MLDGSEPKHFLTADEVRGWATEGLQPIDASDPARQLREGLRRHGQWNARQVAGRHLPMGCVSLEVTQRCNLDCTLCYLSESAEAVRDLPLAEIFRRIDMIYAHYGPATNVQISGGDPTLRSLDDLAAIVRHIRKRDMWPSLFTNGIRATRPFLKRLADAGLMDVAFHVDLTQERRGYKTEADLNSIRLDYMKRAAGLGLNVLFNTTIFSGNFREVPMLAKFFAHHANKLLMVSFQMQADTGRGTLRKRVGAITQQSMIRKISDGVGLDLAFDAPQVGHSNCNKYSGIFEAGGQLAPIFDGDEGLFEAIWQRTEDADFTRDSQIQKWLTIGGLVLRNLDIVPRLFGYVARKGWALRKGLRRSGGRVHKLSFFIHNFMDADHLERDRCESCVFMGATADGPISMCVLNAKRDQILLKPVATADGEGLRYWQPLTGNFTKSSEAVDPRGVSVPKKRMKGRAKVSGRVKVRT